MLLIYIHTYKDQLCLNTEIGYKCKEGKRGTIQDEEGHSITKEPMYQEDIERSEMFICQQQNFKIHEAKRELKKEVDKSTITAGISKFISQ